MNNLTLYTTLYVVIGLLYAWGMEAFKDRTHIEIAGSVVLCVLLWPLALVVWLVFCLGVVFQTTVDALKGRL